MRRWARTLSDRTTHRRLDSARGALLGTFVGDALGMPYEGLPPNEIPDTVEMTAGRLGLGTYTDDTQMMIALAEAVIEDAPLDPERLARRFLDRFDPARGYGRGTTRVVELWRAGVPVAVASRQAYDTQGSFGNGAAMRVAPIGVRYADDPPQLYSQAAVSAKVTHAHPIGIDAAVVQAASVGAAVAGRDILDAAVEAATTGEMRRGVAAVGDLLDQRRASPGEVAGKLGSTAAGHRSVPTALYCALAHDTFEASVSVAVRCGGDTDTVAAMAGAIAGARHGAGSCPARWVNELEDGPLGRSHVEDLARRLHELALAAR